MVLRAVDILLALQTAQATVFGVVREAASGDQLAGAVVVLADLNRSTFTGADGRYVLRDVPAGPQHLSIRLIGHTPRTLHALVPAGGELEINVSLERLPVRLTRVEVPRPIVVRGVDAADSAWFPDRSASIAAVRNHPLLSEPDVFQALGGGEVVLTAESPSGMHVRGGASDHTAYLLDGIPIFSPYHAAGVFSALNPDAIDGVHLSSAAPSPGYPDALSGAVEALTRVPGSELRAQGSVSSTQARITVDGPLGVGGAGFLFGVRSAFQGLSGPKDEPSYLRGDIGDWLGKLELPAFGGALRLLGFESNNEISAIADVAAADGPDAATDRPRNVFEWRSRSLGMAWRREMGSAAVRLVAWSAKGGSQATWAHETGSVAMEASRRDEGLLAAVERGWTRSSATIGIRLQWSAASYDVEPEAAVGPRLSMRARTPIATAFAQGQLALGSEIELQGGASLASGARDVYLGPRARVRWRPTERFTVSGSFARLHQFSQSLRNAESVVGNVFPPDLYMGAGARGVPVARSDQGVLSVVFHPIAGAHVGVQAFERRFDGLLLVAPRDGDPFSTGGFAVGSGRARGVSVDAAMARTRYALMGSYGLQRVRYDHDGTGYVPDHGTLHLLEGGITLFPTATSSIRIGGSGAIGRRTTTSTGGLEWGGVQSPR